MNIKNILISFFLIWIHANTSLDGVVAVVGDKIITNQYFNEQVALLIEGGLPSGMKRVDVEEKLLENLINQVKNKVLDETGIKLELELEIIGKKL